MLKTKTLNILTLVLIVSSLFIGAQSVYARLPECDDGTLQPGTQAYEENCTDGSGSNPTNNQNADSVNLEGDCEDGLEDNCAITGYIRLFTNILSALVGIVIVIMTVVGGIQYSAARDNPQAVQAAKQKITNAMLALFAYIFMFAFLQWIVPGGLL